MVLRKFVGTDDHKFRVASDKARCNSSEHGAKEGDIYGDQQSRDIVSTPLTSLCRRGHILGRSHMGLGKVVGS